MLLAMAGRSPGVPGRTTTPAGGRAPSAGRAAGCTIDGAWRTCGTTRRGASPDGAAGPVRGCAMLSVGMTGRVIGARAGTTGAAGGGGATTTCGEGACGATAWGAAACGAGACGTTIRGGATCGAAGGGATTTGAGRAGSSTRGGATATTVGRSGAATIAGRAGAACSAWRRAISARATSPGFEARDRSNFGLLSPAPAKPRDDERPPVRCLRTFSASSSSMELEWVFFSVTPTAVSASRMLLLLTSSSRARSLMRTLLIRPRYSVTLC